MSWWGGGFSASKLKSHLKMASQRIVLVNNKMENKVKKDKKAIAKLLEIGKDEKARVKVEHVIRDDFTMEAHELIELLCETVVARLPLICSEKECPYDMVSAVSTLIYVAPRVQIPEILEIRKQFQYKYGKEFAARAARNVDGCVNERIIHKLSVQPPNALLVRNYLMEIAKQYHVNWQWEDPSAGGGGGGGLGGQFNPMAPMPTPSGFSVTPGGGSGYSNLYQPPAQGGLPVPPSSIPNQSQPQPYQPPQQQSQQPPRQPQQPPPQIPPAPGGGGVDIPFIPAAPGMPGASDIPPAPGGGSGGGAGFGGGSMGSLPLPPQPPAADVPPAYDDTPPAFDDKSGGLGGLPMPPSGGGGMGGLPMPPSGGGGGMGGLPMPPSGGGGGMGGLPMPPAAAPAPAPAPPPALAPAPAGGDVPDFDELTARFNALRGL